MGNRITPLESPQGFAAEAASGATILASSYYGYPLSTTQVVSGGVVGAGLGKKLASVNFGVVGQMVTAWVFTIPAAGLIGAGAWELTNLFGVHGGVGSVVVAAITAGLAAGVWVLAQRNKITPDELDRTRVSPMAEATDRPAEPVAA
jgi:inorganic phosphate transporter, PiT family